uniref:Uncharacterized protein n=1 Tax=Tanacetum cinerariifolium TaxID=118510 RepID=A0A6L2MP25_TANCI|nr:hypothetical protein [Tanacetum cinerariifolium]
MKLMQAYNATSNESLIPPPQAHIAPPTVFPSSPVLPPSPLFDPQDFFLPDEILPPQKQACFLSSSFIDSFAPPQVKENSKKDKIGSKPDKNRKRGEARKSQKQLQWIEEEKLKKTQKEGPKMKTHVKSFKL